GVALVLLARGGDAGPDAERDQPAVPEPARPGRVGPAGAPGDRPAAPGQQPALGLHSGRAAPAERDAAGLRVRPSLWVDAPGEGGARAAAGGQPLQVPGGVP